MWARAFWIVLPCGSTTAFLGVIMILAFKNNSRACNADYAKVKAAGYAALQTLREIGCSLTAPFCSAELHSASEQWSTDYNLRYDGLKICSTSLTWAASTG